MLLGAYALMVEEPGAGHRATRSLVDAIRSFYDEWDEPQRLEAFLRRWRADSAAAATENG